MKIESFVFNPYAENTYLVYDDSGECAVIDPGCSDPEECENLASFIENNHLNLTLALNTHGHIDHILGNDFVKRRYKSPLLIGSREENVYRAAKVLAPNWGFPGYVEVPPDRYLEQGDEIRFGKQILEVLFVPGHSPGHIAFYHPVEQILFGGDVLFRESIGRTDLPGGDHPTLIKSIHEKFFTLPDTVKVFPGHGPSTTIGYEKTYNPFCGLASA